MSEEIIQAAKALCEKFIAKCGTGRARSIETLMECEVLLKMINARPNPKKKSKVRRKD